MRIIKEGPLVSFKGSTTESQTNYAWWGPEILGKAGIFIFQMFSWPASSIFFWILTYTFSLFLN